MPIDPGTFIKNRSKIPLEEMAKFAGQWVAWSPDGTHIVAGSAQSDEALWEKLKAMGLDPFEHVTGYIPGHDEAIFGLSSLVVTAPKSERPMKAKGQD